MLQVMLLAPQLVGACTWLQQTAVVQKMGAIMQDAVDMMMPEGTDVPAPVHDALGDMGQGLPMLVARHDMAGEAMPRQVMQGFRSRATRLGTLFLLVILPLRELRTGSADGRRVRRIWGAQ